MFPTKLEVRCQSKNDQKHLHRTGVRKLIGKNRIDIRKLRPIRPLDVLRRHGGVPEINFGVVNKSGAEQS